MLQVGFKPTIPVFEPAKTVHATVIGRYIYIVMVLLPVMIAEWSRACTVFAPSEAGTVVSNSTQGIDV
jgi:hypothetical protein